MNTFSNEDALWRRVADTNIALHTIHDPLVFHAEQELGRAIRHARASGHEDLLRILWKIRWTILQTLLPFGHADLALASLLAEASRATRGAGASNELETALHRLVREQTNRKRELLTTIFCETSHPAIHLWSRPRNEPSPGIPDSTQADLEQEFGRGSITFLMGKRAIPDVGEVLVLTSPLHVEFPAHVAKRLLSHGRWREIHVVAYAAPVERLETTKALLETPAGFAYWNGRWHIAERTFGMPARVTPAVPEVLEDEALPPWDAGDDWGEPDADGSEPIRAVAIGLSGQCMVAYPEDGSVLVLNREPNRERIVEVPVCDLERGDLIPVLTSGPGAQALDEAVAARFGGSENLEQLKARCLSWKMTVSTCLQQHGTARLREAFHAHLGRGDVRLPDDAWSSDSLLAPGRKRSFAALLHAVRDLGFFRDVRDMDKYITDCWIGIRHLRGAPRAEGRRLNDDLQDLLVQQVLIADTDWAEGDEVSLVGLGRCYRFYRVEREASIPFDVHPCHLEKLKPWH